MADTLVVVAEGLEHEVGGQISDAKTVVMASADHIADKIVASAGGR